MKHFCILPVSGRRVEIQPVSHWLLDAVRKAADDDYRAEFGELPEPPTDANDEAAREAYLGRAFHYAVKFGAKVAAVALLLGVVGHEPTPEWESRMRALRLKIPDDAEEKRLAFIQSTVINDSEDGETLVKAILELSEAEHSRNQSRVLLVPGHKKYLH